MARPRKDAEVAVAEKADAAEAPKRPTLWRFQSVKRGYSFPDPRVKEPSDPYLLMRYSPPLITFIHSLYTTREESLAKAMIARIGGWRERNEPVEYLLIEDGIKVKTTQPQAIHGGLSVVTAKPEGAGMSENPPSQADTGPGGFAPVPG